MKTAAVLSALLLAQQSSAKLGVDISQPISVAEAKCLAAANVSFSITRAWMSFGEFDKNVVASVVSFQAAGISTDVSPLSILE